MTASSQATKHTTITAWARLMCQSPASVAPAVRSAATSELRNSSQIAAFGSSAP